MTIAADASVLALGDRIPDLDPSAFVAAGARLIGEVTLGEESSVWYNTVLRADSAAITWGWASEPAAATAAAHSRSPRYRPEQALPPVNFASPGYSASYCASSFRLNGSSTAW